MNANELADLLEVDSWYKLVTREEIATMLRQQQAEIEALKKDNKELHAIAQRMAMAESDARKSLQWFKDARERQSEPVAWMSVELDGRTVLATYEFETAIPLYTHPVKEQNESFDRTASHMAGEYVSYPAKTLTDEEILKMAADKFHYSEYRLVIEFARAILRKAQEK